MLSIEHILYDLITCFALNNCAGQKDWIESAIEKENNKKIIQIQFEYYMYNDGISR